MLCYNKARELGIPTKKLPLAEFIKLTGREVLTCTHVIHLMLRYFDNLDWKEAFETVLPQRKLEEAEAAAEAAAKAQSPQAESSEPSNATSEEEPQD